MRVAIAAHGALAVSRFAGLCAPPPRSVTMGAPHEGLLTELGWVDCIVSACQTVLQIACLLWLLALLNLAAACVRAGARSVLQYRPLPDKRTKELA